MNFVFQTTRSICCELGAAAKVGQLMKSTSPHIKSVLLVTDRGVVGAGLAERVQVSLEKAGIRCSVYDSVVADPPSNLVLDASKQAREAGVEGVVGVGGGSPMDVAKLVAFLNGSTTQGLDDVYGVAQCVGDRLPLIQVPTTAGTGSEVTPIAIITTGENEKKGVVSDQLYPDWAVLDGNLTHSIPHHTTAATGIDAMVHAIEAYTSRIKKNPLSDVLAKEALRLLGSNIIRVCENGDDSEARMGMLLGSCYAGMAFANAPVGAVHALAYPIGSHFHVPHGLSNSLVLPHVLRHNASDPATATMYADVIDLLFPLSKSNGRVGGVRDTEALAACFEGLANELGIETQLGQVGVKAVDIELLAGEAMKQTRLLPNNPVEVTLADATRIYTQAF